MKKLLILILLFSVNVHASCDWKTGITPGPNKTFIYVEECHQAVGALVQANKDLTSAIQLKDLAIQTADQRTDMWKTTAENEQDRMTKLTSEQGNTNLLYYALGILTVIGSDRKS